MKQAEEKTFQMLCEICFDKFLWKFTFVCRILNDEDDSDESSGRLVIDEGQHPCNVCGQVSFQKYFNIFILKISISESQFMEIMEKQI